MISALKNIGLDVLWEKILEHRRVLTATGELSAKRRAQMIGWMWAVMKGRLVLALEHHPEVARLLPKVEEAVTEGRTTPPMAAQELLAAFGLLPKP